MADDKKTSRLIPKRPDRQLYVPWRRQPTSLISQSRSHSKESTGKRVSLESSEESEGKVEGRSSPSSKKKEDLDKKQVPLKKSENSRRSLHDDQQPEDRKASEIVIQTAKSKGPLESSGVRIEKADEKSSSASRKREVGRKQLEKSGDSPSDLQDVQQPEERGEKESEIRMGKDKLSLESSESNNEKVDGKASPASRKRGVIGNKRSPLKKSENARNDLKEVQKPANCKSKEIEVQTVTGDICKDDGDCKTGKELVGNERCVALCVDTHENGSMHAIRSCLSADERFSHGDDIDITNNVEEKVRKQGDVATKRGEAQNEEKQRVRVVSIADEDSSILDFATPDLEFKETTKNSASSDFNREKSTVSSEIGARKSIELQKRNSPICDELGKNFKERSNADFIAGLTQNMKIKEGHAIVNYVREVPICHSTSGPPGSKLEIRGHLDVQQSPSILNDKSEQILAEELDLADGTEHHQNIVKNSFNLEAERMLNDSDSTSFCHNKMDTENDVAAASELIEDDVVGLTAEMVLESGIVKASKRIGEEPTRGKMALVVNQPRSAIDTREESSERLENGRESSRSDLVVESAKLDIFTEDSLERILDEDTDSCDLIEVKNKADNDSSMNSETESKILDYNESNSEENKSGSEKSEKFHKKEKSRKKFVEICEDGCHTKTNAGKGKAKSSKEKESPGSSPGGRKMKVFRQEKKKKGKGAKSKTDKLEKGEDKKNTAVEEMDCDLEENDDWEVKWNETGDCLSSEAKSELEKLTGIEKPIIIQADPPEIDYFSFEPKQIQLDSNAFQHLVEIYDFSPDMTTTDICLALQTAGASRPPLNPRATSNFNWSMERLKDFDIKWVDDTHAIGIFGTSFSARQAIKMSNIQIKIRPVADGTKATKLKVRSLKELLLPYKPRPETTASVARNLVTSALGVKSNTTKEQRAAERQKIKEAKERKKVQEKMKRDAWGED